MAEETEEEVREDKKKEQAAEDAIAEKAEESAAEAPAPEEEVPAEEEAKEKKDTASPEKPLDKMTVKELREVALKMGGIEGVTGMKKEQLLALIKKAKGIEDEPVKKKKKLTKVEGTVGELKQKIAALKKEKLEAQKAKDKTQIKVLRRRINRLKKKTRKTALAA